MTVNLNSTVFLMCIFNEIEPLYWTSEGESTFKYWMLHQDSDFNDDRNSYVSGPLFELDNECITTRDGTIFHSGKQVTKFSNYLDDD